MAYELFELALYDIFEEFCLPFLNQSDEILKKLGVSSAFISEVGWKKGENIDLKYQRTKIEDVYHDSHVHFYSQFKYIYNPNLKLHYDNLDYLEKEETIKTKVKELFETRKQFIIQWIKYSASRFFHQEMEFFSPAKSLGISRGNEFTNNNYDYYNSKLHSFRDIILKLFDNPKNQGFLNFNSLMFFLILYEDPYDEIHFVIQLWFNMTIKLDFDILPDINFFYARPPTPDENMRYGFMGHKVEIKYNANDFNSSYLQNFTRFRMTKIEDTISNELTKLGFAQTNLSIINNDIEIWLENLELEKNLSIHLKNFKTFKSLFDNTNISYSVLDKKIETQDNLLSSLQSKINLLISFLNKIQTHTPKELHLLLNFSELKTIT
jgi:hypothetical protein